MHAFLQLHSLCGKGIVSISAGKYWTAAVSVTGNIYMWDGKKGKGAPPTPTRLHGVKKATSVSVGETHLLIVSSLYLPCYIPHIADGSQKQKVQGELDELCEGFMFDDGEYEDALSNVQEDIENLALHGSRNSSEKSSVPSLKSLCEKMAAEHLVEPRNAMQLLEIADTLEAHDLKRHCEVWFSDSCYYLHHLFLLYNEGGNDFVWFRFYCIFSAVYTLCALILFYIIEAAIVISCQPASNHSIKSHLMQSHFLTHKVIEHN